MIFFRVVKYLRYIILSRHRKGHGIHSPFVFDLITRVFRNKIDDDIVFSIEKVRKRLNGDHRSIQVKDLGAGAESFGKNIRRVSDIARYSAVPLKYGVLLSNMAAEFGKPFIMEFGTSFGISTMYMAASCSDSMVYTIEGSPSIAEIAADNFSEVSLGNIKLNTGSFDEILAGFTKSDIKPGLVFIDGNHRKKPTVKYFTVMAEISDSKTVIIIDDINYSGEMQEAWNLIKGHKKVTMTIDIFRMGMIFFREGINDANYIIRY